MNTAPAEIAVERQRARRHQLLRHRRRQARRTPDRSAHCRGMTTGRRRARNTPRCWRCRPGSVTNATSGAKAPSAPASQHGEHRDDGDEDAGEELRHFLDRAPGETVLDAVRFRRQRQRRDRHRDHDRVAQRIGEFDLDAEHA